MEQENLNLRVENASLKASAIQQKKKVSALEGHMIKTEAQIDTLLLKLNSANDTIRSLQQEVSSYACNPLVQIVKFLIIISLVHSSKIAIWH